jgi:hypothetical protein
LLLLLGFGITAVVLLLPALLLLLLLPPLPLLSAAATVKGTLAHVATVC